MKQKKLRRMKARVLFYDYPIRLDARSAVTNEIIGVTIEDAIALESFGEITAVYDKNNNVCFCSSDFCMDYNHDRQFLAFIEDYTCLNDEIGKNFGFLPRTSWSKISSVIRYSTRWKPGSFARFVKYVGEFEKVELRKDDEKMGNLFKYRVINEDDLNELKNRLWLAGIPFEVSIYGNAVFTARDSDGKSEHVIRDFYDNKCYPESECTTIDGKWYSKANADRLFTKCSVCGKYHIYVYDVDSMSGVCRSCLKEIGYTRCPICGEWHNDNDHDDMDYHGNICNSCFAECYVQCDDCDEYINVDNSYTTHDGRTICSLCREDYRYCGTCEELFPVSDMAYVDGEYYCEDHRPRGIIHDYSYKPDCIFIGSPKNRRYFGIELETEGGNHYDFVGDALEELSPNEEVFYFKRDGSLDNTGAELVTHPMSYDEAMKFDWESLHYIAQKNNQTSHDSQNCGLHIHVSKDGLGDSWEEIELVTARIICVFDRYFDEILKFARRRERELQWCHRNDADFSRRDSKSKVLDKLKCHKDNRDRYRAINLNNYQTIEFRVFHGSLKPDTVRATITFVNDLIEYCKNTDMANLISDKKLFDQIKFSDNVVEYAKTRGLVD